MRRVGRFCGRRRTHYRLKLMFGTGKWKFHEPHFAGDKPRHNDEPRSLYFTGTYVFYVVPQSIGFVNPVVK